MTHPIASYAMLGDGASAAMVALDGGIDFLCWPRFDSDAVFAALLGDANHGTWRIAPDAATAPPRRTYRDGTLVLETVLTTATGTAALIEFMPIDAPCPAVIRIIEGRTGQVTLGLYCAPRCGFGAAVPQIRPVAGGVRMDAGGASLLLATDTAVQIEAGAVTARFTVTAGAQHAFTLAWGDAPAIDPLAALAHTETVWRDWCAQGSATATTQRSLILLKALCHTASGGVVAAATTSLPEQPGGVRNWDYRFCWLRDSSLMLTALLRAGHHSETAAWVDWLVRACGASGERFRILFRIDGGTPPPERTLDWLPGHGGARPVRVGNGAADQLQLDVFGELADLLHQARACGAISPDAAWGLHCALTERLETLWLQPDEGIWEVRGGRQHFTFSKMMAWVAFDRALRDAATHALPAPTARWQTVRDAVHARVCAEGFSTALGSFTQTLGGSTLDASVLLMVQYGFLPPDDARLHGTVDAIQHDLADGPRGLLLRYRADDGLPRGEGCFLACDFWLVEALAMLGRTAQARARLSELVLLANDVGMLSEEIDTATGAFAGNLPQGLSHAGLVAAASRLGAD